MIAIRVTSSARRAPSWRSTATLYDPATDTWTPAAPLAYGRLGSAATLLPNGTVLIVDGTSKPEPQGSCEIYDPGNNTFSPTGALLTPHVTPRASLLQNGKVFVTGGDANWFKYDPLPASNVAEMRAKRVIFSPGYGRNVQPPSLSHNAASPFVTRALKSPNVPEWQRQDCPVAVTLR